jgi:hypothetical protein
VTLPRRRSVQAVVVGARFVVPPQPNPYHSGSTFTGDDHDAWFCANHSAYVVQGRNPSRALLDRRNLLHMSRSEGDREIWRCFEAFRRGPQPRRSNAAAQPPRDRRMPGRGPCAAPTARSQLPASADGQDGSTSDAVCCADSELEEARLDLSAPRTGVLRPERAHADPAATRPPAGGALPRASTAAAVGAGDADDAAALAAAAVGAGDADDAAALAAEFASLSAGEGGAADDTPPAAGGGAPRAAAHAVRAGEEVEAPAQRGAAGEGTGGDAGGARVGGADRAAGEHAAVQWEMEQTPEALALKVRVPRRPGVAAAPKEFVPACCPCCAAPGLVRAPRARLAEPAAGACAGLGGRGVRAGAGRRDIGAVCRNPTATPLGSSGAAPRADAGAARAGCCAPLLTARRSIAGSSR